MFLVIGPLNPAIRGIGVASVIAFSLCLYVLYMYVTNFLILLQHNIRQPSPNCNVCATKFVARGNIRRHDTSTPTYNECHGDFSLRVRLRRPIRSKPPKPAPATCIISYDTIHSKVLIKIVDHFSCSSFCVYYMSIFCSNF